MDSSCSCSEKEDAELLSLLPAGFEEELSLSSDDYFVNGGGGSNNNGGSSTPSTVASKVVSVQVPALVMKSEAAAVSSPSKFRGVSCADELRALAHGLLGADSLQLSLYQSCVVKCILFCVRHDMSMDSVLGFTVHNSASGSFFSLVVDFVTHRGKPRLLSHYPSVDCSRCESQQVGEFRVSWNCELAPLVPSLCDALEVDLLSGRRVFASPPVKRTWSPFCCREVVKMHDRRLQRDSIFQALVAHRDTQPGIVYEVKTMQISGSVYERKFFKLENSVVSEVHGVYNRKVHAFKNYWCHRHDLWFSVDLYAETDSQGPATNNTGSCHQMRMSPFTHLENEAFISLFFSSIFGT